MNADKFRQAYEASRNGCNKRIRHPLARKLVYSDGVEELAEAGAYWLLDVVGTEHVPAFFNDRRYFEGLGFIKVKVTGSQAVITLVKDSDEDPVYTRDIEFTDLPEGEWTFYLSDEGSHAFMFLPSEY